MVERIRRRYGDSFHFIKDWEGWAALVLVIVCYGYTYYAFVWLAVIPIAHEYPRFTTFVLFSYHVVFAMTLICWIQAMLRHPGSPIFEDIWELGYNPCKRCKNPKPSRTHHCSTCNQCILRMDHHCPFINNCVGWRNHKAFVLFLIYHEIYTCVGILWTIVIFMIRPPEWSLENIFYLGQVAVGVLLAVGFFAGVLILLYLQLRLVCYNMTMIEFFEKWDVERDEKENQYFLGYVANLEQIFGPKEKWYLWPIPIQTNHFLGRGTTFQGKED